MNPIRLCLAMVAALSLSACNIVMSETPMFEGREDRSEFKPGIWVGQNDPACDVDYQARIEDWPECANGTVIAENGDFLTYDKETAEWRRAEVTYSHGEPSLIEIEVSEMPGIPSLGDGRIFFYLGFNPVERDEQDRVTRFESWIVMCGPVEDEQMATQAPFAGLRMDEQNCIADDPAILRNAAAETAAAEMNVSDVRWIREAD